MKIKHPIFLSMIVLLLAACSNDEETESNTVLEKPKHPEGIQLELIGVGEAAQSVFEEYFHMIEEGHRNMIYPETESIRKHFEEDRPDLENAKLTYNAENNEDG